MNKRKAGRPVKFRKPMDQYVIKLPVDVKEKVIALGPDRVRELLERAIKENG